MYYESENGHFALILGEGRKHRYHQVAHHQNTHAEDSRLIGLLRSDPDRAMMRIFELYYEEVCRHIYRIVTDAEASRDIAQSVFMELWSKRATLDIHTSVGAYLHKAALTRALNYLRDNKKHHHEPDEELKYYPSGSSTPLEQLTGTEMQQVITQAIDQLPARCREVFVLSRYEGMSYAEIAETLSISTKTVENQISKALAILRTALHDYHRGKSE